VNLWIQQIDKLLAEEFPNKPDYTTMDEAKYWQKYHSN
jgi:hypothetical protein